MPKSISFLFTFTVDPQKPEIHIVNETSNYYIMEGKDFSLPYNVIYYPDLNLEWRRSKDDTEYELIYNCSHKLTATQICKDHEGKENISKTSFEVKGLKYPQDNYYYQCYASNKHGNDSTTFRLQVYGNLNMLT